MANPSTFRLAADWRGAAGQLLQGGLDVLLPTFCAYTGIVSNSALSETALRNRPAFGLNACATCLGPVDGPLGTCRFCEGSALDLVIAAAPYCGWWKKTIRSYKFEPRLALIDPLAHLLGSLVAQEELPPETLVVPIPPTNRASIMRAGDLNASLARGVARRAALGFADLLQRKRPGQRQHQRSRAERAQLDDDLLKMERSALDPPVVVLVDDVMTTGATMNAAGRLIKRHWPRSYLVAAVLARVEAV